MQIFNMSVYDIEKYDTQIVSLMQQSFEISFPREKTMIMKINQRLDRLKEYVRTDKGKVFGVRRNDTLIGFLWFFTNSDENTNKIHVNQFVVDEEYRNLGIGTSLWNELESYAIKNNCTEFELMVSQKNENALRYYLSRDFTVERLLMKKRLKNDRHIL